MALAIWSILLIVPPLLRDALQLHNGVVYPGLAIRLTDVDIATMETAAIQKYAEMADRDPADAPSEVWFYRIASR